MNNTNLQRPNKFPHAVTCKIPGSKEISYRDWGFQCLLSPSRQIPVYYVKLNEDRFHRHLSNSLFANEPDIQLCIARATDGLDKWTINKQTRPADGEVFNFIYCRPHLLVYHFGTFLTHKWTLIIAVTYMQNPISVMWSYEMRNKQRPTSHSCASAVCGSCRRKCTSQSWPADGFVLFSFCSEINS